MKFKEKIIVLGAIIGVLTITFVIGAMFSPEGIQARKGPELLFPGLETEKFNAIWIKDFLKEIKIKKENDQWIILLNDKPHPAKDEEMQLFFDGLKSMKKTRVVTSDPELYEKFGLVDNDTKEVRLFETPTFDIEDPKAFTFFIGKTGGAGMGDYVRVGENPNVILLEKVMYAPLDPPGWCILDIFPEKFEGRDVIKLDIKSDIVLDQESGEPVVLDYRVERQYLQEDNTVAWKIAGKPELTLDGDVVEAMAERSAEFSGYEFASDVTIEEAGLLDNPSVSISVTLTTDVTYTMIVGNRIKDYDQFYAKLEGDRPYIYTLPKWKLVNVLKDPDSLVEEETEEETAEETE